MVKRIEDLNYYELLEVSPRANSQEIHRAYERARKIYEPNSIALYSLFTPEETATIYQRVEDAYRTLMYETNRKKYDEQLRGRDELPEVPTPPQTGEPRYQAAAAQPALPPHPEQQALASEAPQQAAPAPRSHEEVSPISPFIGEFTGPALKVLREQRNLSIRNIADLTKVGARYIESIEEEAYQKLPARPYTRGFLTLYAKALGYDPDRVVVDYLKRYDAAMVKPK
jgi:curved DNA-binding protein CbpA